MNRSGWIILVAMAAGLLSFLATLWAAPQSTASASDPLARWLALAPAQQQLIAQDDPGFEQDLATLTQKVNAARDTLATLLKSPQASEEQVLRQVDTLAEDQHQLQRRVTQHLLRMRAHLTPDQQTRLTDLSINCVRGQIAGTPAMGRGPGPHGFGYGGGRGRNSRGQ